MLVNLKQFAKRSKSQISFWLNLLIKGSFKVYGCFFLPLPGDHVYDEMIQENGFENREVSFVQSFLKNGQTFWDIGANFGLYTLLAAYKVGETGSVLAIEPEPKNYFYLRINLLLNSKHNVQTLRLALGDIIQKRVEFLSCTQGAYSGLKVAKVPGYLNKIQVEQTTLDMISDKYNWMPVDFLKMDVEGAEMLVLRGGENFFKSTQRPIVMCEFSDRRTIAFNYKAQEVYNWLVEREYQWFAITKDIKLIPQPPKGLYDYDNLIGCPIEKLGSLEPWIVKIE